MNTRQDDPQPGKTTTVFPPEIMDKIWYYAVHNTRTRPEAHLATISPRYGYGTEFKIKTVKVGNNKKGTDGLIDLENYQWPTKELTSLRKSKRENLIVIPTPERACGSVDGGLWHACDGSLIAMLKAWGPVNEEAMWRHRHMMDTLIDTDGYPDHINDFEFGQIQNDENALRWLDARKQSFCYKDGSQWRWQVTDDMKDLFIIKAVNSNELLDLAQYRGTNIAFEYDPAWNESFPDPPINQEYGGFRGYDKITNSWTQIIRYKRDRNSHRQKSDRAKRCSGCPLNLDHYHPTYAHPTDLGKKPQVTQKPKSLDAGVSEHTSDATENPSSFKNPESSAPLPSNKNMSHDEDVDCDLGYDGDKDSNDSDSDEDKTETKDGINNEVADNGTLMGSDSKSEDHDPGCEENKNKDKEKNKAENEDKNDVSLIKPDQEPPARHAYVESASSRASKANVRWITLPQLERDLNRREAEWVEPDRMPDHYFDDVSGDIVWLESLRSPTPQELKVERLRNTRPDHRQPEDDQQPRRDDVGSIYTSKAKKYKSENQDESLDPRFKNREISLDNDLYDDHSDHTEPPDGYSPCSPLFQRMAEETVLGGFLRMLRWHDIASATTPHFWLIDYRLKPKSDAAFREHLEVLDRMETQEKIRGFGQCRTCSPKIHVWNAHRRRYVHVPAEAMHLWTVGPDSDSYISAADFVHWRLQYFLLYHFTLERDYKGPQIDILACVPADDF